MKNFTRRSAITFLTAIIFALVAVTINAQTTAFTYQGKLTDGAAAASGNYDMQFRLFDNPNAGQGTQQGVTFTNASVPATNGIFTVQLDFGSAVFAAGADLYLEISLRPAGSAGGYTNLAPRQRLTSAPYAIRALSAGMATIFSGNLSGDVSGTQAATIVNSVGGQSAANVAGATQSINTATSVNTPNTLVKRDANGNFSANIINAATQYNIGGNRVLSVSGGFNLFAGAGAGSSNTTGDSNSFVGDSAGFSNMEGGGNSFFGRRAGGSNVAGFGNSFFGSATGFSNTTGGNNSFFGSNTGFSNTTGQLNSFFGMNAGSGNQTGQLNSFFGTSAGVSNQTGSNNTLVGYFADVGSGALTFATALGAGATVNASNTVVLGRSTATVVAPNLLKVNALGVEGATQLCRNASNQISTCSSSLRYKTNIAPFQSGLNLVNRLQPITFNWRANNHANLGLGAEDVAKIEPLLVTYNERGEVEGVKYDRVAVVLLNAVKEQ